MDAKSKNGASKFSIKSYVLISTLQQGEVIRNTAWDKKNMVRLIETTLIK